MFKKLFCNVPSVLYQNRFCRQEHFDIISSVTFYDESKKLLKLHYPSLNKIDNILDYETSNYSSVVTSSDVYTFCRQDNLNIFRYEGEDSEKIKYNKKVVLPEKAVLRFACSFMKYLFVYVEFPDKFNTKYCLKYNIKTTEWTYKANWNCYRFSAACAIFEGKIVMSDGYCTRVGAYDYYEDNYTYLPDMIKIRSNHGAVSMGNKMFVIGGERNSTSEVFDSISRKFTYITNMLTCAKQIKHVRAVGIDRKIIVFPRIYCVYDEVHIFDTVKDECCIRNNLDGVKPVTSCSKLPIN